MALTEIPETVWLEPAHGRRKARVQCYIPGCERSIIEGHVTCSECYRKAPYSLRAQNRDLWRRFKASSGIERDMLAAQLDDNCLLVINAIVEKSP